MPNNEAVNNPQNVFLFKAVLVDKKSKNKGVKFKNADSKTIGNIIDALLEIDKKVLEKLS